MGDHYRDFQEVDAAISQDEEALGNADDLEVEIIEQRIVFVIPALPPRTSINKTRKKAARQRSRQQQQQHSDHIVEEVAIKAAIKPNGRRLAVVSFPAPSTEDRMRASFLRKRVERRGGLRLWLGSKGLGRFARVFQEHEIDVGELSQLTMDALKEIGVQPVGPRRKLITAIQKLCI